MHSSIRVLHPLFLFLLVPAFGIAQPGGTFGDHAAIDAGVRDALLRMALGDTLAADTAAVQAVEGMTAGSGYMIPIPQDQSRIFSVSGSPHPAPQIALASDIHVGIGDVEESVSAEAAMIDVTLDRTGAVAHVVARPPKQAPAGVPMRLSVYDMSGALMKVICEQCGDAPEEYFTTTDLASGIYAVVLESPSFAAMQRLLVQH